jgi:hypothetical protein
VRNVLLLVASTISACAILTAPASGAWEEKAISMPVGATKGELFGISCASELACTAVGHFQAGIFGAFGDEWNGSSWKLASIKANEGDKNGNLWNVSCFSSTRCYAVGAYGESGVGKTLAESSNKGSWTHVVTPNSGTTPELYGVSCTSLEFCLATGHHQTGVPPFLVWGIMAEEWEGTSWKLLSPPENPGGQKNGKLWGVSCIAESSCKAVGSWGKEIAGKGFGVPGEESWNGLTWTSTELPAPATSEAAELYDISCKLKSEVNHCLAVGGWKEVESGKERVLVEIWNGSSWKVVVPGVPSGATKSEFKGVSCVSAESCELVGNYRNSEGSTVPLAEVWSGGETFSIQTTPIPKSATSSQLEGVSCVAVEECNAVGYYSPNFEEPRPFALHL